ncbi:hypothetical protein HZB60_11150 [candidate division KSB1 bacterium]|nr:hypothetical protein [candidate division KSB1 bacterium]
MMNRKLWMILLAVSMVGALFFVGCKEDDEETPAPPDPIFANWNATNSSLQAIGLDEFRLLLTDNSPDDTYQNYQRLGTLESRETGSWTKVNAGTGLDSLRFHATVLDDQPVNEVYSYWYELVNNNSQLNIRVPTEEGPFLIVSMTK